MKKLSLALCAIMVLGCEKQQQSPTKPAFHRYPIEKGHVHYEFVGDIRGYEDLYFDRYDIREVRASHYDRVEASGFRRVWNHYIGIGGNVWHYDPVQGTGDHTIDPTIDSLLKLP